MKLYHLWHNSWCWRIWEFLTLECDLYLKPSEWQETSHITYFQLGRDDGWISSGLGFRVCSLTSPHPVLHPHYWASWKIMKYLPLTLRTRQMLSFIFYLYLVWQKDWNLHGSTQSVYSWKKIYIFLPKRYIRIGPTPVHYLIRFGQVPFNLHLSFVMQKGLGRGEKGTVLLSLSF